MVCRDMNPENAYNSKRRFYDILKANAESFVINTVASFTVGVGVRYVGGKITANPLIYGALVTPIIDSFEFTITHRKGSLEKTLQNDVGTFLGASLGWALASLL